MQPHVFLSAVLTPANHPVESWQVWGDKGSNRAALALISCTEGMKGGLQTENLLLLTLQTLQLL